MKAIMNTKIDIYKKFTELENILLGIDAEEYLDLFEKHEINLEQFLTLSEDDLEGMGINKLGVRKRMVEAIVEIHKKDWEKTSLPTITPKDRQKGIYFTCPEAVVMIANMNNHMKFLSANVSYLTKNIKEHPELLRIGQDVADLSILVNYVRSSKDQINKFTKEIKNLNRVLGKHKGDPQFAAVDKLAPNSNWIWCRLLTLLTVTVPVTVWCFLRYKK